MKRSKLVFLLIVFAAMPGTVLTQPPSPTTKENPDVQQQKEKTAAGTTADLKAKEEETSKTSDEPDPVAERKKKAQNILNRCYQEALDSDPQVRYSVLQSIAGTMMGVDRKRAEFIYEQAFTAALDPKFSDSANSRITAQANIARMLYVFDLEKAIELAQRIESYPGGSSPENIRLGVISSMFVRLVDKDPERVFGIMRQEMTRGDSPIGEAAPVVLALRKNRPDLAEILYIEAIRQSDKAVSFAQPFVMFIDMASSLFDLNRALTAESVEHILKGIDYLKEHPPTWDLKGEVTDGDTKTSFNGVREYAILKVLPLVRQLDPDRARRLEETFSANRQMGSKTQNPEDGSANAGSKPASANPSAQQAGSTPGATVESGKPPSATMTMAYREAPGVPLQTQANMTAIRAAEQARRERADQELKFSQLARRDPTAAEAQLETFESGPARIRATVLLASALAVTNPEKAKGLLNDAGMATDKLSEPFDKAECDGLMANVFLRLDQNRTRQLLNEAFLLMDQLTQEENDRKAHHKLVEAGEKRFRSPQPLILPLLRTLGKLNMDDAIARAEEIQDKQIKLRALVDIAQAILAQR